MNKSYARSAGSGDRHFGRFFSGFGDWHANGAELGGKDGFGGVLGHALVQLLERHCGTERQPATPDGQRSRASMVVIGMAGSALRAEYQRGYLCDLRWALRWFVTSRPNYGIWCRCFCTSKVLEWIIVPSRCRCIRWVGDGIPLEK